ncbi:MAG: hypothetical protein DHS20C12_29850 [Pseudohongiella sp.]|nr:MAG: hypothetical protein DHS20C12_29850 [Pseudohongiella sp.]
MSLAKNDVPQDAMSELLGILKKPYHDKCDVCRGEGMITPKTPCPKCKGTGERLLKLI